MRFRIARRGEMALPQRWAINRWRSTRVVIFTTPWRHIILAF